uniref:Ecto-NOX disulfide-thiol exchanger 2 n=1 Tax=Seriola dumerili TaxID=41447 RepID=A0A3B4TJ85_SERDU
SKESKNDFNTEASKLNNLKGEIFDPRLGLMTGTGPINPMMPGLGLAPPPLSQDVPVVKEIIHCKSCTLFPPNPRNALRERPGGLPENATEQLITDVFGQRGDIAAIRKSKKNFCHIRFTEEFTVDMSLPLSGHRIYLSSSTGKTDSGRLHVDLAQARDDLYEWECRQCGARWRRIASGNLPIIHYSKHERGELGEEIKDDSKFPEAVRVFLTWLERGEVSRRNANNFYSMIQSSNNHIHRRLSEKSQQEKEMEEAKEKFKTTMAAVLAQCESCLLGHTVHIFDWCVCLVFIRRLETCTMQLIGIRGEEEMEMSDDDMDSSATNSKDSEDSESLKEENDSLRCQLDANRNEVELSEEDNMHPQQLSFLQQALQDMQKQLLRMREELKEREAELERSVEDKQQLKNQIHHLKSGLRSLQTTHTQQVRDKQTHTHNSRKNFVFMWIIPTFLHAHPFGASIECICSYLQCLDEAPLTSPVVKISIASVGALLSRLPCTFRQELTGVGARLEKRWNFCGFQGIKST